MKKETQTNYLGTQNIDNLTTAERSLQNSKRLDRDEAIIQQIADAVQPENVLFADGTIVATQATRAEDIVSVEDVRLQEEIDLKVSIEDFELSQARQDAVINTKANQSDLISLSNVVNTKADQSDLDTLQSQVSALSDQVDVNAGDINSLETRMTDNEAKDNQQDIRLALIEDELQAVGFDYSTLNDSGLVTTTPAVITPTIVRDFATNLATNQINGLLQLTTTVNTNATVKFGYEISAEQASGQLIDFTIELYNLTTGLVVDSATHTIDFSGTTVFETIGQSLIGTFAIGDQVQIRVKTDVGSVNVTKAKGVYEINSTSGGLEVIYDYNVNSTSIWGQANTKEDLESVYNRIVDNETQITQNTDKIDEIYNQYVED